MRSKLNPQGTSKINFPGFQEILDFTATGSESSVALTVDGDVDKEYKVIIRNLGTNYVGLRLNGDSGDNYGYQYIANNSGTITGGQGAQAVFAAITPKSIGIISVLTPTGFIKTSWTSRAAYSSGTTMSDLEIYAGTWSNTGNVTTFNFFANTGFWASGTRIIVYVRRSN